MKRITIVVAGVVSVLLVAIDAISADAREIAEDVGLQKCASGGAEAA